MKTLRGRTALITGASRGIGIYIAQVLAAEGMNLVLVARSLDALETVAEKLRSEQISVATISADLGQLEQLEALVEQAEAEFDGIDVLVNNAGLEFPYVFDQLDTEFINQVLTVNLNAPILLARLFLPKMLDRGRGHIVNMASLAGLSGTPYDEVYAASKHGLVGFSRSLSLTAVSENYPVGVSVICPGFVADVGMYEKNRSSSNLHAGNFLKPVSPDKVAKAVVKAIVDDVPEIIVNSTPVRPYLAIQTLFPSLSSWFAQKTGVNALLKGFAHQNSQDSGST